MDNFDKNQEKFIGKLENVHEVFREIRDKDKKRLVIQHNNRDIFENLIRNNDRIIDKLKKREFTVAVVGLEKAGKSTLANALLKLVILPEYSERCTYTTTEIRAGSSDTAEVYFYSKEKFDENFRKMLREVEYPLEKNFDELELDGFMQYWNKIQTSNSILFQHHNGTTVADIKTILEAKDDINYLVGKNPEVLDVNNPDDYDRLHRYITGIENYRDGHVERVSDPYAVEKVVIKSTGLNDMQNIILYDVPGFDSPTELHKKQTEDMLKMSDAIILVTNVGDRPNLTGTQLDMLQKGRDADGINLSEKVFVFGNKLDMSGNLKIAQDNASALIHDATENYRIALKDRIVCGSAKAYLEKAGKLSRDDKNRGTRNISATLESWGVPDGIEELKAKMQSYYENDRFEVLQKRAEKNVDDAKKFLSEILAKYDTVGDSDVDDGSKYFLQAKDALDEFSSRAVKIGREYRQKIAEELPFSSLLNESIEEIYPSETDDSARIIAAENTTSVGETYALSRTDSLVRENLFFTFQNNLITKTAGVTLKKEAELYQALTEGLLQKLKLDENSPYRADLEESVKNLFKSLLIEHGEHCHFNPIIERYATGLIETLIKTPYASAERLKKLINAETMPDFQSLAIYYKKSHSEAENTEEMDLSVEDKQKYFFTKIITHDDFAPIEVTENENALKKFFEDYDATLAAGFDVKSLPFTNWATLLKKLGIKVSDSDLLPRLKDALIKFINVAAWSKMSAKDKNRQLDSAIIGYCLKAEPKSLVDYIVCLNKQIRGVENKAEMLMMINEDIEILRDFTLNAVVRAMGLERAFISVMSQNIDLIRKSIDTAEGQQIFNDWLKSNMRKIRADEYAEIEKNIDSLKDKKIIADSIREVLKKLDR